MIYNADDDTSEFMRIGFGGHQTSYGIERAADYHGTALAQFRSETALGIDFLCEHSGSSTAVRVLSPGEFSASDALVRHCAVRGLWRKPGQAAQTLAHTPVQGRFEVVEGLPGRTFIVDYSHNGLALTSALKTLRAYNPHKLLCVFGSVGGRTQVRRRELAEAAGAFADYSIITSDNPDFEPPEDVIKEIASHMPEGAPYTWHHRPPRCHPRRHRDGRGWGHHPVCRQRPRGLPADRRQKSAFCGAGDHPGDLPGETVKANKTSPALLMAQGLLILSYSAWFFSAKAIILL